MDRAVANVFLVVRDNGMESRDGGRQGNTVT
jgi:hypothetical protein